MPFNERLLLPIWLILLPVLAVRNETAAETTSQAGEQLQFSAEDKSVKAPVQIPQDVVAVLEHDELVRNVLANQDPPLENAPLSWFSASAIHLSSAPSQIFW
jgi:hypothetical protein